MPLKVNLRYFTAADFRMDGQDVSEHMNSEFLIKLDTCRDMCGFPFIVTSSYRSPSKNRSVGGSPGSMHLKGRAVDIRINDGAQRWKVIRAAATVGLSVGIMAGAVHLDDRDGEPVCFHYYKTTPAGNSEDE